MRRDYDDDYDDDDDPPPRRGMPPLLIAILSLLFLGCACCGGLAYVGMGMFSEQAMVQIRENPEVVEHVGEVREGKLNWGASFSHNDVDVFVFDVKGPKGSGQVTASFETSSADEEVLNSGEIKMASGETYDLLPVEKD